jgi:hypothetical protein
MCPGNDNPIAVKFTIIHFPYAKTMSAAEIRHELCVVYRQNVMSEVIER